MKARHIEHVERRARRARFLWTLAAVLAGALVLTTGPIFAAPSHGKGGSYEHHRSDRHHGNDRHHGRDRQHGRDWHDGRDWHHGRDWHDGRDWQHGRDRHHDYDRHHRDSYRGYDGSWRHRGGHYSDRRYDHRRFDFVVPRAIARERLYYYDDYYYGRVYYPEHHHYHTVYRFPVFFEGQLVYRPYAYCDGNYFATGFFGIDGPHFSIHIGF